MGVATRVHHNAVQIDGFMAKGPLDGRPGLPAVQYPGIFRRPLPPGKSTVRRRFRNETGLTPISAPHLEPAACQADRGQGQEHPDIPFQLAEFLVFFPVAIALRKIDKMCLVC